MSLLFILFLATIIFFVVWSLLKRFSIARDQTNTPAISNRYLEGLNFLLNEQPDKAVDVFIEMIEVDSDTVETHLALGALFRRRGEVDRAIRIHQNLIARPNLNRQQRVCSLYELAQDYMRAGVLDRAEALFQELVNMGEEKNQSLHYLIDIYQQQRDWEQAIITAQKIESVLGIAMEPVIAHYYCELAQESLDAGYMDKTSRFLKRAMATNSQCVRAELMQANLCQASGKYEQAIYQLQSIAQRYPSYITEVLAPLKSCYQALGQLDGYEHDLQYYARSNPEIFSSNASLCNVLDIEGVSIDQALIDQIQRQPTMNGLQLMLNLKAKGRAQGREVEHWQLLREMLSRILAKRPGYLCSHCGFTAKQLLWFCPSCKHWDSIQPISELASE